MLFFVKSTSYGFTKTGRRTHSALLTEMACSIVVNQFPNKVSESEGESAGRLWAEMVTMADILDEALSELY